MLVTRWICSCWRHAASGVRPARRGRRDGRRRPADQLDAIFDAARLFRPVADILALRPALIRRGLHLRVESGLLSRIDLASDDPGTKMVVSVLEFQRDMISENTRKGIAAAKATGRPAAINPDKATTIVEEYRQVQHPGTGTLRHWRVRPVRAQSSSEVSTHGRACSHVCCPSDVA